MTILPPFPTLLLRGLVLSSALGLAACGKSSPPADSSASAGPAGGMSSTTVAQSSAASPAGGAASAGGSTDATTAAATPAATAAPSPSPSPAPAPTTDVAAATAAEPPAAGGSAAGGGGGDAGTKPAGGALYKVVGGTQVDAFTMEGFRTWRAAACDRCHGPNQEGLVGPSLINSLKTLSKDDFKTTVLNGRLEKGMPSFKTNEQVASHIDNLYAYLKGRSDGAITSAKVTEIK